MIPPTPASRTSKNIQTIRRRFPFFTLALLRRLPSSEMSLFVYGQLLLIFFNWATTSLCHIATFSCHIFSPRSGDMEGLVEGQLNEKPILWTSFVPEIQQTGFDVPPPNQGPLQRWTQMFA